MCYDDKVRELASALGPAAAFTGRTQAKEFAKYYQYPVDSSVYREVEARAEAILEGARHFGVEDILQDIGTDVRTKLSALREALRLEAREYLEQRAPQLIFSS